jgi:Na+-transporting NADH:ubiquinone oxidoreductase subunit F
MAENVLDHRLNCRTVHMNFINRYFYWNMNYHVEHHMFPLVPYYHLPKLHELVKPDMPAPYSSVWNAWREIVPTVLRQLADPSYCVKRKLPPPAARSATQQNRIFTAQGQPKDGWFEVCPSGLLRPEDVIRFDRGRETYAIYRTAEGILYATDGRCTHGGTHLAQGLVIGMLIECPKHNGRFDFTDGSAQRLPACKALNTHKVREIDGKIFLLVAPRASSP